MIAINQKMEVETHQIYDMIKNELVEIENITWEMKGVNEFENFSKLSDEKFNVKWALAEKIKKYIESII